MSAKDAAILVCSMVVAGVAIVLVMAMLRHMVRLS